MASLLNLVDTLIGNVLQGNIYNNVNTYVQHLGTVVNPKTNISDMRTPDPIFIPDANGSLNVTKAQVGPKIDPNLGINKPQFTNTDISLPPQGAIQTPADIRQKIYQPDPVPPDVGQQIILSQQRSTDFSPAPIDVTQRDNLKNNLYDNGPISFVKGGHYSLSEGFIGPLRNFDIFAIAHWVRNIGSEIGFLPKFVNNSVDKAGSFQGPVRSTSPGGPNGAETLIKSTQWLATNLLLASLNTGNPQAYGPLNLVWNPLSLLTAAVLPARGISPTERPTVGNMISTYKDNLEVSIATNTERLLLVRQGLFSEVAPVKRLQQLRSPVMPPGFRGDMNGSRDGGDTLDKEVPSNPANLLIDVEAQTGGLGETLAKLVGVHTNIYSQDRPYGLENAAYPLEKIETDISALQKTGFFNGSETIKTDKLFTSKPFPGGGLLDSGRDMTFIAKPTFSYLDKQGIKSEDLPDNVDAAFSVLDEDSGVVAKTIDDDKNYMPFMFQDLRDRNDTFLYLRAFLKSLTETFTPEWTEERFYGRTEAVPIYKGTSRNINLTFDMVAWSPKDLPILYKKLQKLQSMVYPLYDEQGFLKAGPIIRMRVGDLISTGKDQGLPRIPNINGFKL